MIAAEYPEVEYRRRPAASASPLSREEPLTPPASRPAAPPAVRPRRMGQSRPMAQRGPFVVRRVRALGWRSPETLAVLVASFVVSLAAIYVAAYARVAADTFEASKLSRESRQADEQKDALLARLSELSLASDVQKTASQMNMVANDAQSERLLDAPRATAAMPNAAALAAPVAVVGTQP